MEPIYIVAAKRTPIGNFNGGLSSLSAVELGAHAMKAAIEQSGIAPDKIDEVIVGNVLTAGNGMGTGRQASIHAGIPSSVPAYTLNMICGSGMKALTDAASHIRAGDCEVVMTCGMESMSNAGFVLSGDNRRGHRMGHQTVVDTILKDGLTDAFHGYPMGITAENIVDKLDISRHQQDEYALSSQQKAIRAQDQGHFDEEIAPVTIATRKSEITIAKDEFPKRDCTLEKLSGLHPAFDKQGSVTAGNASGINDGASAILLASTSAVKKHNLTPLAELVEYGQAAIEPEVMGLGPVNAIANTLRKADMSLGQIDCFELNEAFAAQSLGVIKQLSEQHDVSEHWIAERSNPNGGAIALGHPIGASGNRIVTTLVYQLRRDNSEFGLASLCIGGGMGTAVIVKPCR
ncbi:acetyl-CoA acetyltransferase [Vibrio nigripulchritudo SFn27]|uniref:Acetyl-CoA acetyltransferase n=1 Tax=Vibrio nigripulchritudo TaxID=28173 RepID=U4K4S4_9VIBR|nr:acetyl-CoA C-acetyltransferase [Vibrio nigripulchritudo]CCN82419.1 acetyl-CoA acetyltransferase [Vibrio nigripulchritudo BLFn1]CCN91405.1 acetyl-CoA acetyltransferase [Vibrio nigripulchritudo SFn27]CCN97570.1 acetyl-CoA acetyltransferase [Vibrio nigripulchritudo ENn2]CCO38712.1 acetyl-CoA acetyltransferase [Vibrio nigripulchritudo SFn135]CCO55117.1 acetyl-CoA acetyltransferase [Vibrio nigripulchritudo Wn13]